MNAMEPSTVSGPSATEPVSTSATKTKTYGDRHFKPTKVPGLVGPDFPIPQSVTKFLRRLFRRKEASAA